MPLTPDQAISLRIPVSGISDIDEAIIRARRLDLASAILSRTDQKIEMRQGDQGNDDDQRRDSAACRMAIARANRLIAMEQSAYGGASPVRG